MFIMPLQAVTAGLIFLYIGISYYLVFPRTGRGHSFLMVSFCLAWWSFCVSFRYTAPDVQTADFWFLLGSVGFIFFPALGFRHFAYRSKQSVFLTGPIGYLFFLPPVLLFAWLLRIVPGQITFVLTPLGWQKVIDHWSPFIAVYTLYYACYLGAGLIVYMNDDALSDRIYGSSWKLKLILFLLCSVIGAAFIINNLPLRVFSNFPNIFPVISAACALIIWIVFLSRNMPVLSFHDVAVEILENMNDALVAVKEDGCIIYSNEKARGLTGFDRDSLSVMMLSDLFADPKPDLSLDGKGERSPDEAGYRLTLLSKHALRIPVTLSINIIPGFWGGTKGAIGIIRDIRAELEYKAKQDEHRFKLAAVLSDITAKRDLLTALNEEAVERELKMIGIKKEINEMLLAAGEKQKYKVRDKLT